MCASVSKPLLISDPSVTRRLTFAVCWASETSSSGSWTAGAGRLSSCGWVGFPAASLQQTSSFIRWPSGSSATSGSPPMYCPPSSAPSHTVRPSRRASCRPPGSPWATYTYDAGSGVRVSSLISAVRLPDAIRCTSFLARW